MSPITFAAPLPSSNIDKHGVSPALPASSTSANPNTTQPDPKMVELQAAETNSTCKIPIVRLDVDIITDLMAARLAISLLGHVLFLKSQVPFPVMQLSRIPSGKSSARAVKQRNDLLSSFDTLTSHLNTTFTALSNALARRQLTKEQKDFNEENHEQVYLAIMVGPSIGSAKSKIIYAVDGLQAKLLGTRDDIIEQRQWKGREENKKDEERAEDESEDQHEDEEEELVNSDYENSSSGSSESSGDDLPEHESDLSDNEGSPPPQSRSPSPLPTTTHAEHLKALSVADRLLSRTLATADAEGHSMAAEMSPTQAHVLIRAPRRFDHPAWIPRQNISASLDGTLDEFLEASGLITAKQTRKSKSPKGKVVEGVWVTCREGLAKQVNLLEVGKTSDDEKDDMIWWSWDGKIVGFSEW